MCSDRCKKNPSKTVFSLFMVAMAVLFADVVIFGWLCPMLVSAKSTIAMISGFLLAALTVAANLSIVLYVFDKLNKSEDSGNEQ